MRALTAGGGGTSFTFDLELGIPVKNSESFGPLLAERADTLGARRLSLAFSYTRIDFKRFNGESLSNLSFTLPSVDTNGDGILGPPGNPIELDRLRVDLDLEIENDIFAMFGRYGITEFWDTELIVPIIRVRARARAEATVVCNDTSPLTIFACEFAHRFDPASGDAPSSSAGGRKTGIGDVVLRSKYHFLRDSNLWPDLSLRGQIKLPTGDEKDLLGTGETDFQLMLIASKTWWRLTPHLNLAYELSTGPSEFDNLRYAGGLEVNAHRRLTLAVDVIGRWAPDGDSVSNHISDIALGARVNVWRTLLLNANFQIPLNRNTGLRPDFIWTVGVQYGFGGS